MAIKRRINIFMQTLFFFILHFSGMIFHSLNMRAQQNQVVGNLKSSPTGDDVWNDDQITLAVI
jgi:hypothetical protein